MDIHVAGQSEFPSYLRLLLAGDPGVGKTHLSAHFPNPLFLNARCGIATLSRLSGIPFVSMENEESILSLRNLLAQPVEGFKVDTLVIDSIDEVQRLLLQERLEQEKRTETKLDDYGWLLNKFHAIFTGLDQLDLNIVYVSHLKDIQISDSEVCFKPALAGQFADAIHEYVDASLVMRARSVVPEDESEEITVTRWLTSTPSDQYRWSNDKTGRIAPVVAVDDPSDTVRTLLESLDVTLPESKTFEVSLSDEIDEESSSEKISCDSCGAGVDPETPWPNLSQMKFKQTLCSTCFRAKS